MTPVSITIPVFNEEAVIAQVIDDCKREIIARIPDSEIIVVNDGSTDGTYEILQSMRGTFQQLVVIHSKTNNGYGAALRMAFEHARKDLVFNVDGDGQFSVKDFWQLYKHIEECDIVAGYRRPRFDPWYRKVFSFFLRCICVALFGVSFRDVNAPFKIIKAGVLHDVMAECPRDFSATPVILWIMAKLKGYRVVEVPVAHFERKTGRSTMTGFHLIKISIIYLRDLFKLKCRIICGSAMNR